MTGAPTAHYRVDGDVAVIELDFPPVNALAFEVRQALVAGLAQAAGDDAIRAIVLIGAGGVFCGGADLRQLGTPKYWAYPRTIELAQRMDDIAKPVVAAIGKLAMGGGLELALGCHYRIAGPDSRLALPEAKLGLMPGGGGTLRLPRLVGVARALEMMLGGDPIDGTTALQWGLIDSLAPGGLLAAAVDFARARADAGSVPRRARDLPLDRHEAANRLATTRRDLLAGPYRGGAALAILECVEAGVVRAFDDAVELTARRTAERMASDESKGHRHLFFAEREAAKVVAEPPEPPGSAADIVRVAIIAGPASRASPGDAGNTGDQGDQGDEVPMAQRLRRVGIDVRLAVGAVLSRDDPGLNGFSRHDLVIASVGTASGAPPDWLGMLDQLLPPAVPIVLCAPDGELGTLMPWRKHDRLHAGLRLAQAGTMRLAEVVDLGGGAPLRSALARLLRRAGLVPVQTSAGPSSASAALLRSYRERLAKLRDIGVTREQAARVLGAWGIAEGPLSIDEAWPVDCPDPPTPRTDAAPADDEAIVPACLQALQAEGRRLVSSGQVRRNADIDVILVAGCGFPGFRGGAMFQATLAGADPAG